MKMLIDTYKLKVGQAVMTRARARNCCSWSHYSQPHSSDIIINQAPQVLKEPRVIKVTADGFTMKWPQTHVRSILYCNNGEGTSYVPRYTTSADYAVNVPAVAGVLSHRCYLRAQNECGFVESAKKAVKMPLAPSAVLSK